MSYLTLSERMTIPNFETELKLGAVRFDLDKCNSCTLCVQCCPGSALEMHLKKPRMVVAETPQCMACGDCVAICSEGAVELTEPVEFSGRFRYLGRGDLEKPRLFTEKSR